MLACSTLFLGQCFLTFVSYCTTFHGSSIWSTTKVTGGYVNFGYFWIWRPALCNKYWEEAHSGQGFFDHALNAHWSSLGQAELCMVAWHIALLVLLPGSGKMGILQVPQVLVVPVPLVKKHCPRPKEEHRIT